MKNFFVTISFLVLLAACSVGPLSSAKVITTNEKEVVILSDGFVHPFRTANAECGRYGKTARLDGRVEGTEKQLYYYKCE